MVFYLELFSYLIILFLLNGLGVDSGDTIRVPKVGNAGGRGVEPGNLYIKLKA